MTATAPSDPGELDRLATVIDRWLDAQMADNPAVLAIDRDVDGPRSWFVRLQGEEKDVSTIRFWLRQRTLLYETFFMPAPEENQAELYEHVLRRNAKLFGASFVIGDEDAIYLRGQLDHTLIEDAELDRVLGSLYQWIEQFFRPALRIGFASKFTSL